MTIQHVTDWLLIGAIGAAIVWALNGEKLRGESWVYLLFTALGPLGFILILAMTFVKLRQR